MVVINNKKNIRSFGRINGRGRVDYGLLDSIEYLIDSSYKFNKESINHFEIGFGYGESLLARAANNPNINYIGCETYVKGVINLYNGLKSNNISNVKIFNGDARLLLEEMNDDSIDMIFILFPDPWPKKKQNKRRIISDDFLNLAKDKLKNNGKLFFATDIEDYMNWTLDKLFKNGYFNGSVSLEEPSWWVRTKYQEKAIKEGRSRWFLEYSINK